MSQGFEIDLAAAIEAQSSSQKEIQEMVLEIEKELDVCLGEMSAIHLMLRDKLKIRGATFRDGAQPQGGVASLEALPSVSPEAEATIVAGQSLPVQSEAVTGDDQKDLIGKLLLVSIDSLRAKLSTKILDLFRDIKSLEGVTREEKILELYEALQFEHVDMAGLISAVKVEERPEGEIPRGNEVKDKGAGSIVDDPEKTEGGK